MFLNNPEDEEVVKGEDTIFQDAQEANEDSEKEENVAKKARPEAIPEQATQLV